MKILIGFDGSDCSEAALDDLKLAGLPKHVEAVIMSVAEVWLPPPAEGVLITDYAKELQSHPQQFKGWQEDAELVTEAEALVKKAEIRLRTNFPKWNIVPAPTYGSPAWEILAKADEMKADLIIVGSHGRSALGRFFLGSISQKVLTEAQCSVRVARGRIDIDPAPAQLVIGFDGSKGAQAAVEAVSSRHWPEGSRVILAAVTNIPVGFDLPMAPATVPPNGHDWIRELAEESLRTLRTAGLHPEFVSEIGNPKHVLVDIAEKQHATSIFVGANRFGSRVERFLLGSVSAAVAARAHCSVEVVRRLT
jgi:nucleotide-binding universal stress UspA family protein